ncbi:MAG: phosphatase PAP2 family protein [Actinobacteria bacterium]|nr:phosphatase PAP2 family protein [Actinomycetota bacterium]
MTCSADTALLRLLRKRGHSPGVERAVASFSKLGEHGALWLALSVAGAGLSRDDRRREFTHAAVTVAASFVANQGVKLLVRRRRPHLPDLPPLTHTMSDRSYPSAHATTSAAGARALSPLLPPAPLYAVAGALALSRPYLGVHYPSDTVAGAVLGVAVAELRR